MWALTDEIVTNWLNQTIGIEGWDLGQFSHKSGYCCVTFDLFGPRVRILEQRLAFRVKYNDIFKCETLYSSIFTLDR